MPSDALNALIAKQKGNLSTLMPAAPAKGSGLSSATGSTRKLGSTEPPAETYSDFKNQRAGVGSPSRDRLQEYEEKVLDGLAKRKEEKAIQMGGGKFSKGKSSGGAGNKTAAGGGCAGGEDVEGNDCDFDPSNGTEVIDRCFVSIGGVKAFTSFQRLSPGEQECIETLTQLSALIKQNQTRDLHLNDLTSSITGNEEEEEDEPIGPQAFSQYYFYNAYIRDLVYFPDKFDFLIRCIENSVVKVAKPSRFIQLMERIAARGRVDVLPDQVVNYERLLDEDEEKRLESFTLKKDWVCQVPHYLDGVGGSGENLPPVTTVDGTWNHKDTTVDMVRRASASPTPSEDDRAREEEERKDREAVEAYKKKNRTSLGGGAPTKEALAIISEATYQWKRIRVPKTRATESDKERRISNFEFSSNRRQSAKDHARTYPSHDGTVRLPAEGEWALDADADGLYWCHEPQDVALYFDPVSGQFYDPAAECWYYEELGGWHSVGSK